MKHAKKSKKTDAVNKYDSWIRGSDGGEAEPSLEDYEWEHDFGFSNYMPYSKYNDSWVTKGHKGSGAYDWDNYHYNYKGNRDYNFSRSWQSGAYNRSGQIYVDAHCKEQVMFLVKTWAGNRDIKLYWNSDNISAFSDLGGFMTLPNLSAFGGKDLAMNWRTLRFLAWHESMHFRFTPQSFADKLQRCTVHSTYLTGAYGFLLLQNPKYMKGSLESNLKRDMTYNDITSAYHNVDEDILHSIYNILEDSRIHIMGLQSYPGMASELEFTYSYLNVLFGDAVVPDCKDAMADSALFLQALSHLFSLGNFGAMDLKKNGGALDERSDEDRELIYAFLMIQEDKHKDGRAPNPSTSSLHELDYQFMRDVYKTFIMEDHGSYEFINETIFSLALRIYLYMWRYIGVCDEELTCNGPRKKQNMVSDPKCFIHDPQTDTAFRTRFLTNMKADPGSNNLSRTKSNFQQLTHNMLSASEGSFFNPATMDKLKKLIEEHLTTEMLNEVQELKEIDKLSASFGVAITNFEQRTTLMDWNSLLDRGVYSRLLADLRKWKDSSLDMTGEVGMDLDVEKMLLFEMKDEGGVDDYYIAPNNALPTDNIMLLLDTSGSMDGCEVPFLKSMVAIIEALENMRLNYSVLTFSSQYRDAYQADESSKIMIRSRKTGEKLDFVRILKDFKKRKMDLFVKRILANINCNGGTPTGRAIHNIMDSDIWPLTKYLMVFTDGQQSDGDHLKDIVRLCRTTGKPLMFIGVYPDDTNGVDIKTVFNNNIADDVWRKEECFTTPFKEMYKLALNIIMKGNNIH